jgi:hypothetical protein
LDFACTCSKIRCRTLAQPSSSGVCVDRTHGRISPPFWKAGTCMRRVSIFTCMPFQGCCPVQVCADITSLWRHHSTPHLLSVSILLCLPAYDVFETKPMQCKQVSWRHSAQQCC